MPFKAVVKKEHEFPEQAATGGYVVFTSLSNSGRIAWPDSSWQEAPCEYHAMLEHIKSEWIVGRHEYAIQAFKPLAEFARAKKATAVIADDALKLFVAALSERGVYADVSHWSLVDKSAPGEGQVAKAFA